MIHEDIHRPNLVDDTWNRARVSSIKAHLLPMGLMAGEAEQSLATITM